jgi:hypothetical protein
MNHSLLEDLHILRRRDPDGHERADQLVRAHEEMLSALASEMRRFFKDEQER